MDVMLARSKKHSSPFVKQIGVYSMTDNYKIDRLSFALKAQTKLRDHQRERKYDRLCGWLSHPSTISSKKVVIKTNYSRVQVYRVIGLEDSHTYVELLNQSGESAWYAISDLEIIGEKI